ncbi:uncharacterized protein FTJAE_2515 [Fusarium tjaetaba]|uniref:Uncharacterized protein n=1 Tax=Fusarium tjaetaba TaxID=1567544 RepID=A0A8H5S1R9_9HYPO|nr:uncharacterized protein FTJAE_2515 [Fusarium tjaetaba]KAF5645265.1 hypothetical protein FTJAE_2515 [Fusarium tjaetaba]
MARARLGAQRRRKLRKKTERLRKAFTMQDHDKAEATAQAAASSAQASATENVTEATAEAATNAPAPDAQNTTDRTETRRCKHRHLPDRHYYYREEVFDRRFLALDRRINERLDDNIAKGRAAMDEDYRSHKKDLQRTRGRLARQEQEIQRTLRLGLKSMELEVKSLKWRVDNLQQENETLQDDIERERRSNRRMMRQLYESPDHQETDRSD